MFIFGFTDYPPGRALPQEPLPDFDASAAVALNRTKVMNAHLSCLHTAVVKLQNFGHDPMVVNPSELLAIHCFEESWGGASDRRLIELSMARYISTYRNDLPTGLDWRISSRHLLVETSTLEESFRLLNKILNNESEVVLMLCDLYTRSHKAYNEHNYSLCLILAWSLSENLLQRLWKRFIEENRSTTINGEEVSLINADRKRALEDGGNFSASVISEVLSFSQWLPISTYKDLSATRRIRNNWIHNLAPVSRESASVSVRVAEQMLQLVEELSFEASLNLSLHG